MSIAVEIAVQDPAGARTTLAEGADRIELCQALGVGGLTPSIALIEAAVAAIGGARVNVLVRPRGGGFVYSDDEATLVFHRAIDATPDLLVTLGELRSVGVDRILTSDGAPRSIDGVDTLARMVAERGDVEIMAGGGIRTEDIPALVRAAVAATRG